MLQAGGRVCTVRVMSATYYGTSKHGVSWMLQAVKLVCMVCVMDATSCGTSVHGTCQNATYCGTRKHGMCHECYKLWHGLERNVLLMIQAVA